MSQPQDLVIAHQANSPAEAQLIKTLLEDNGITAFVPDSNVPLPGVDLTPFSNPGGAGCDVLVQSADVVKAKGVIEESRRAASEDRKSGAEDE